MQQCRQVNDNLLEFNDPSGSSFGSTVNQSLQANEATFYKLSSTNSITVISYSFSSTIKTKNQEFQFAKPHTDHVHLSKLWNSLKFSLFIDNITDDRAYYKRNYIMGLECLAVYCMPKKKKSSINKTDYTTWPIAETSWAKQVQIIGLTICPMLQFSWEKNK